MRYVGLDIGTTSICGVVYDLEEKRSVRSVTLPNESAVRVGKASAGIQDAEAIVETAAQVLASLSSGAGEIAAIGITGQMHGIVYVDANGRAVSPLYTWQNQKGATETASGVTLAEALTKAGGYPVATGYGLVTHAALSRERAVPTEAVRLCTIADYVAIRLTGAAAPAIEASNAASLGFFDAANGVFDRLALERAGVDAAPLLPEVLPATHVVGRTPEGVPVLNAIGDNQASVLGSVPDLRASLLANVGTGGQLSAYTERYVEADGLETRPFPGGGYLLVGASLAGGKAYAMLEAFFRDVLTSFAGPAVGTKADPNAKANAKAEAVADASPGAGAPSGQPLYERMAALLEASDADGSDELEVTTLFLGTRADPLRRGEIRNIGPNNFTAAHLIRGCLHGIAGELRGFFVRMPEDVRARCRTLTGSGNGLRLNGHLRKAFERTFGLPLRMPACREEAAIGAALHAAVGTGAIESHLAAGRRLVMQDDGM